MNNVTETVTVNVNPVVETEKFREINVAIVGSKKLYPKRYTPISIIKKQKNEDAISIPAKLEFDDKEDLVYALFFDEESGTWDRFGHINKDAEPGFKTDSDFRKLLDEYRQEDGSLPKFEVTIKGSTSTSTTKAIVVVCSVKIYGETAREKLLSEMTKNAVDAEKIKRLATMLEDKQLSEKVIPILLELIKNDVEQDASRIPKAVTFNNSNEIVEDVLFALADNSNLLLAGPMAAGKNTLIEHLANLFDKALYEIQINSYVDNDTLLGTRTIAAKNNASNKDEINKAIKAMLEFISGNSQYAYLQKGINENDVACVEELQHSVPEVDFSVVIEAMKNEQTEVTFVPSSLVVAMERGSWIVIDEFNAGPPAVMAVLNSVLDDRKRIQVPGYGLVQAKKGFQVFATMNPNYEGTFTLNAATSSRFVHVNFEPADSVKDIILSRVPNADKDFYKAADKLYKHIRNSIESGQMQEDTINVRGFIEAAKMNCLGRSVKRSLITCVVNGIADLDDKKAVKDFIDISLS